MKKKRSAKAVLGLIVIFCLGGCSSVQRKETATKSVPHKIAADQEASSALTSVAGYYAGKKLSEREMKELSSQIQKDEEAQGALEQLNQALTPEPMPLRY